MFVFRCFFGTSGINGDLRRWSSRAGSGKGERKRSGAVHTQARRGLKLRADEVNQEIIHRERRRGEKREVTPIYGVEEE